MSGGRRRSTACPSRSRATSAHEPVPRGVLQGQAARRPAWRDELDGARCARRAPAREGSIDKGFTHSDRYEPGTRGRTPRWDEPIFLRGSLGHGIRRVAAGAGCVSTPARTGGIRDDRAEEALGLFSFGHIARLQGECRTRSFDDDDDDRCGLAGAGLWGCAGPSCRNHHGSSACGPGCRCSARRRRRAGWRGCRCRPFGAGSRAQRSRDRGRLQL